jgi:hypothetical protein
MALRSLSETPTTFERPFDARRSSSPSVETSRRRGLAARSFAPPPKRRARSSSTLFTRRPLSPSSLRSNQSLAMMPFSEGQVPVIIVAWPGAVSVGTWS